MPFPTKDNVEFSAAKGLPTITFTVRGNIDPTAYTVAVSSLDNPERFVLLFSGKKLDQPQQLAGPNVAKVKDLDGRRIKWLLGLTSRDTPNAHFRLDVVCAQDGQECPDATRAEGDLIEGSELAYGFFDCHVK